MAILPTQETVGGKKTKGEFAPEFKNPVGGAVPPVLYTNSEPVLGIRRVMLLDNGARIAAQVEVDRGVYQRPAVSPTEYSFGNIKKSTMMTGVAGYNQRELPIAESPDDMSQQEYMMAMAQQVDPKLRMALKTDTSVGRQFFLNTPSPGSIEYPTQSHQSVDNMLSVAQRLKAQRAKSTADTMMAGFSGTPNDVA